MCSGGGITGIELPFLKKNTYLEPWLVWLSGLSAGLKTKGSLV